MVLKNALAAGLDGAEPVSQPVEISREVSGGVPGVDSTKIEGMSANGMRDVARLHSKTEELTTPVAHLPLFFLLVGQKFPPIVDGEQHALNSIQVHKISHNLGLLCPRDQVFEAGQYVRSGGEG